MTAGVDAITEVPADRWSANAFYHPEPDVPGKTDSRWGGFIEQIDEFEPECFGISPREAAHMDPQQRLLLELAWEALEDAGLPLGQVAGSRTGVFVGISTCDYAQIQSSAMNKLHLTAFSALGSTSTIAANRLSFCLDLRGPSFAIDTACSSSLVAVDRAVRSIWSEECELALAAGVNVITSPDAFISFSAASMLSPEGRCKTFDAAADGFVRAEGGGIVLLKPLKDALRDGDRIYALLLSSGLNQDGRSGSITVPNRTAQETLLRSVYQKTGIDPGRVHYVEAHGTGTPVGDPIEAQALGTIFSAKRPKDRPLMVGSVKTNIGHLEAASGIVGLIKLALVVKHRVIPPNLHFTAPNPNIPFEKFNLRIPTSRQPWPPERTEPAVGGVNSFGFGGTNAHVVVSEFRAEEIPDSSYSGKRAGSLTFSEKHSERHRPLSLPLTARSEGSLRKLAASFVDFLGSPQRNSSSFQDICFSASQRRTFYVHRLAVVASSKREAGDQLQAFLSGHPPTGMSAGERGADPLKVVFVFSGQGTQWARMGRELFAKEPVFRKAIERCDDLLRGNGFGWSIVEELCEDTDRIDRTAIAQPAIFALQVGLLRLWHSWGVVPEAVVGHSVGEVAAAYAAGIYSLEDASRLVFHRGRAMDLAQPGGRMLAAQLDEEEASALVSLYQGEISLAAVNSPGSVTLSGDADAVACMVGRLQDQGTQCKALRVSHAFHSAAMDPARDELIRSLKGLSASSPRITFVSTVALR